MFSKEVIKLAKPTVEAIKKIAEKAGKKCVQCKGDGVIYLTPYSGESKCFVCKGTGKVKGKWEWEPKQGDFIIGKHNLLWLVAVKTKDNVRLYRVYEGDWTHTTEMVKSCIPLLHWEKLVRILESMGYTVKLRDEDEFGKDCRYNCGIYIDKLGVGRSAKDFQEAVQKAVIELEKNLRGESCLKK